jgi:hypothetical protein
MPYTYIGELAEGLCYVGSGQRGRADHVEFVQRLWLCEFEEMKDARMFETQILDDTHAVPGCAPRSIRHLEDVGDILRYFGEFNARELRVHNTTWNGTPLHTDEHKQRCAEALTRVRDKALAALTAKRIASEARRKKVREAASAASAKVAARRRAEGKTPAVRTDRDARTMEALRGLMPEAGTYDSRPILEQVLASGVTRSSVRRSLRKLGVQGYGTAVLTRT